MTVAFWKDAAVRAVKTFAQVVLALMGTGSVGITSLDWAHMLSIAATAAVASLLTSVTSLSNVGPASTGKHVDTGAPTPDTTLALTADPVPLVTLDDPLSTPTV